MDISKISEVLRTLMDIACEGIMIVDKNGIITMVNQVYADFFGQEPEQMIGKHVSDAYLDPRLSRLPVVLKTGKQEVGRSFVLKGKQVIVSRVPVFEDGRIIGAIAKLMFKDLAVLEELVQKASLKKRPHQEEKPMQLNTYDINSFIGNSKAVFDLKETVKHVAVRKSTILIRGESGTGKELIANAIHVCSNRRFGPFVKVNCAQYTGGK